MDNLLDHYEEHGERAVMIGSMSGGGALANIGQDARQMHYDWVEHAFGERLDRFGRRDRIHRRAALIAMCDVHAWWVLSHDLALPRGEVRATLVKTIQGLLEEEQ